MISMNLYDIAILSIKDVFNRCIISRNSKSETINLKLIAKYQFDYKRGTL